MFKFGLGLVLTLLPIARASVDICVYPDTDLPFVQLFEILDALTDFLNNDTYHIETFPLNFTHPAISLYGTFSDLYISNIKDNIYEPFDLTKVILHREFPIFSLTLNNFTIHGNYDLFGDIGGLFYIFGTGPFHYNLYNFNVNVTANMSVSSVNGTCVATNVDVTLDGAEGHFDKFMNDDELEKIINDDIEAILVDVIEMVWQDEKEWNDKMWEQVINKIINGNNTINALWSLSSSTS